jgi:hypothetical protein
LTGVSSLPDFSFSEFSMPRSAYFARAALIIGLVVGGATLRESRAQEAPAAAVVNPSDVIDQIMGLIGQGKIDEAVGMMEGLKAQPNLREAARDSLIHLHDEQGPYRGYDIAAIQRFTGQFETADVLAYYDEQPVLLRFHFYRPQKQNDIKWMVLGFQVSTALPEITEVLKDTPVNYVGRGK